MYLHAVYFRYVGIHVNVNKVHKKYVIFETSVLACIFLFISVFLFTFHLKLQFIVWFIGPIDFQVVVKLALVFWIVKSSNFLKFKWHFRDYLINFLICCTSDVILYGGILQSYRWFVILNKVCVKFALNRSCLHKFLFWYGKNRLGWGST